MPILIEALNYTYDPKTAFQKGALFDIDLDIRDGDFMGVIGHTGSGKSTLIAHLNALIRVQSGRITVDGEVLGAKTDLKNLRKKVGMVFQYPENQLFDETVYKDVAFGPKNLKLPADEIEERVKEAIGLVGLDYPSVKDRSPFELSGGQMRRVALAGVLAMRPEVLVLDEPTAGLDPRGKKEIMRLILAVKQSCKTVVMISHNMDEVYQYCSRIVLMSAGRIVGDYTRESLFENEEVLRRHKMDIPSIVSLTTKLNAAGFSLPGGIVDEDELARRIAEHLPMKGRA